MAGINKPFAEVKKLFFDRRAVIVRVDAAHRKVLSRFGSFVRADSKRSIRSQPLINRSAGKGSKRRPSKPGTPPGNVLGLLKNFIFFAYDDSKRSVVIGPVILPRMRRDNLIMLEVGGQRTVKGIRQKYPARPFMNPAFNKNLDRMPGMYRDSV